MDSLLQQFDPTGNIARIAAANGVPYPFYTVEGRVRFAGGQVIDIRWQCATREPPSNDIVREVCERVRGLVAGRIVEENLTVVRHYNLGEWR